jgi:hypothetical protein
VRNAITNTYGYAHSDTKRHAYSHTDADGYTARYSVTTTPSNSAGSPLPSRVARKIFLRFDLRLRRIASTSWRDFSETPRI